MRFAQVAEQHIMELSANIMQHNILDIIAHQVTLCHNTTSLLGAHLEMFTIIHFIIITATPTPALEDHLYQDAAMLKHGILEAPLFQNAHLIHIMDVQAVEALVEALAYITHKLYN